MKVIKIKAFANTTIVITEDPITEKQKHYEFGQRHVHKHTYQPTSIKSQHRLIHAAESACGNYDLRLYDGGVKLGSKDSIKINGIQYVFMSHRSCEFHLITRHSILTYRAKYLDFSGGATLKDKHIDKDSKKHMVDDGVFIKLKKNGKIYTQGNIFHSLASNAAIYSTTWYQIDLKNIADFNVHSGRCVAWDKDGEVYYWGHNWTLRSKSEYEEQTHPKKIAELKGHRIKDVALAKHFALFLTVTGKLFEIKADINEKNPKVKPILQDETIVAIAAGSEHAVALNDHGEVFTWGRGDKGQLGLGNTADVDTPTKVPQFKRAKKRTGDIADEGSSRSNTLITMPDAIGPDLQVKLTSLLKQACTLVEADAGEPYEVALDFRPTSQLTMKTQTSLDDDENTPAYPSMHKMKL